MQTLALQLVAAFLLGIGSSFHCVAMCGPLAMVITQNNKSIWQQLPYHFGRITSYVFLGLLIGYPAAQGLSFFSQTLFSQQFFTYLMGAVLFFVSLLPFIKRKSESFANGLLFKPFQKIRGFIQHSNLKLYPFANQFVAGALHGFIPCAMVYSAIALSINSYGFLEIGLTMAYFGFGTSISLSFGSVLIGLIPNAKVKKYIVQSLSIGAALLLLYRVSHSDGLFLPSQEKAGEVHSGVCVG